MLFVKPYFKGCNVTLWPKENLIFNLIAEHARCILLLLLLYNMWSLPSYLMNQTGCVPTCLGLWKNLKRGWCRHNLLNKKKIFVLKKQGVSCRFLFFVTRPRGRCHKCLLCVWTHLMKAKQNNKKVSLTTDSKLYTRGWWCVIHQGCKIKIDQLLKKNSHDVYI